MNASLVLVVAPALAAPVLILVGVLVLAGILGTDRTGLHPGALAARWIGSLLGLVVLSAITVVAISGIPGHGPLAYGALGGFGPAAAALVLVLAIAVGERTLPAPHVAVRRASLVRRTVNEVVPRSALTIGAATLGMLLVVSAACLAVADGGRAYTAVRPLSTGEVVRSSFTPFPGYHYLLPIWVGLFVAGVAAVLVLRAILARRPSDDPQDILLRRRSSTSVVGALVLASSLYLLPVAALLMARLLTVDGLARTTSLEKVCIALGGAGVLVGLLAIATGLVMVVFPEVLARRSSAPAGRAPRSAAAGSVAPFTQEVRP